MRNIYLLLFIVVCSVSAAPTRQATYTSGQAISSSDVTTNEDAIFNYLQSGVDTYKDGTILNADISGSANIQSNKLNFASIAQDIVITNGSLFVNKGSDIASAATITLGTDGNFFDITGTTNITKINDKNEGFIAILQFDGVLTLTDGSNLNLAGDFTTTAGDTIVLISTGSAWFELARSSN